MTRNEFYWKALQGLGVCAARTGRFDQSEAHLKEGLAVAVAVYGEGSPALPLDRQVQGTAREDLDAETP